MKKIAINICFGGFSLSDKAIERYKELLNSDKDVYSFDLERDDLFLIQVIEELGKKANGACADIKIVEIPDNVEWDIHYYDGVEHVEEKHRIWY